MKPQPEAFLTDSAPAMYNMYALIVDCKSLIPIDKCTGRDRSTSISTYNLCRTLLWGETAAGWALDDFPCDANSLRAQQNGGGCVSRVECCSLSRGSSWVLL